MSFLQTLVSTGTKSLFLSPTDALHGDIGIVGPSDILVSFSKSGGSEELLKLLPFAKVPGSSGLCVIVPRYPLCGMLHACPRASNGMHA